MRDSPAPKASGWLRPKAEPRSGRKGPSADGGLATRHYRLARIVPEMAKTALVFEVLVCYPYGVPFGGGDPSEGVNVEFPREETLKRRLPAILGRVRVEL